MIILNRTEITHTVQRDHIPRHFCRLFDIVHRTGCDIVKEDFFRDAAAHVAGDRRHQVVLRVHDLFFLRRHQVVTPGGAARNDRYLLNNIGVFQIQADNRMAGLMVCHQFLGFFIIFSRLLGRPHHDAVNRFIQIVHVD